MHVEASGFAPADRDVTVDAVPAAGCCSLNFAPETITIDLVAM